MRLLRLEIQRGIIHTMEDEAAPPLSFETVQIAARNHFLALQTTPRNLQEWMKESMKVGGGKWELERATQILSKLVWESDVHRPLRRCPAPGCNEGFL